MIKIAIAQMDVIQGDFELNIQKINNFSKEAKALGASVLCCPELCTSGFNWDKNRLLLDQSGRAIKAIAEIAGRCEIELFGSFLEKTGSGEMANTLFYIDSAGSTVGHYRKIHLFSLFHEERNVEAGDRVVVCPTALGKTGLSICYDLRFPELFRACSELGAEVQLLPAAFPHPRLDHWRVLVRARAIENQCYFIAVNQCGSEGSNAQVCYFGHSMVVDPWGEVIFEAGETEGLHCVELDLGRVAAVRKKMGALADRRPELFAGRN